MVRSVFFQFVLLLYSLSVPAVAEDCVAASSSSGCQAAKGTNSIGFVQRGQPTETSIHLEEEAIPESDDSAATADLLLKESRTLLENQIAEPDATTATTATTTTTMRTRRRRGPAGPWRRRGGPIGPWRRRRGYSSSAPRPRPRPSSGCPSAQEYYKRRDHCKSGKKQLQQTCTGSSEDIKKCTRSVAEFVGNCKSKAYECYKNIRLKVCECGASNDCVAKKDINILDIKYCEHVIVEHNCNFYADMEKLRRVSSCESHKQAQEEKCPNDKKGPICRKWAAYHYNLCIRPLNDCYQMMMDSTVCNDKNTTRPALPAGMTECEAYEQPVAVPLEPGPAVTLSSGQSYTLLSANGCKWGGRFCLKALVNLSPERETEPTLQMTMRDDLKTTLTLDATGKPNEFYIMSSSGSHLSLTTKACPEAAWNEDYTDCKLAELKTGGEQTPYLFTPIPEFPDQFSITNPQGWQLATNEEDCWKATPKIVLESLSFPYPWKVVAAE